MAHLINRDGRISVYGLACGYVDVTHVNGAQVRITATAPGTYNVDIWGPDATNSYMSREDGTRVISGWSQHSSLRAARKAARQYVRRIRNGEPLWSMPL